MARRSKKRGILFMFAEWKPLLTILAISTIGLVGTALYSGFEWEDLSQLSFYSNLANPSIKVVNVPEGLRKEEVVEVVAKKLNWDEEEKEEFLNAHLAYAETSFEGKYFPKSYMVHQDSSPIEVSKKMTDEYRNKVEKVKKSKSTRIINEDTALIIASLIQREAAGKHDMRLISGIIWNRVFAGMKLQIDATLQYAKGDEDLWWPRVESKDKRIDSPFNTYIYSMPPAPIASPGIAAIEAAYNPQKTSCMYYIHDAKRRIHCAKTYEAHKRNIEKYL